MAQMKWINYEPNGLKPEGQEMLRAWAKRLVPLSGLADLGERGDLAERERARFQEQVARDACARTVASFHILTDLLKQGWSVRVSRSTIGVQPPVRPEDTDGQRKLTQMQLLAERDQQLRVPSVREFVGTMEKRRFHDGRACSVFSLMRDGRELAAVVEQAQRSGEWSETIRPYVQFVQGEEKCALTGLRLVDIWRYFRHTWSNPYKSVPGRTMMILVRDAAAPFHPVIGIAALSSAAVGLTVRDEFIGWTIDQVEKRIAENPSKRYLDWLEGVVNDAVQEMYLDDLLQEGEVTVQAIKKPTEDLIARLMAASDVHRREHYRLMEGPDYKPANPTKILEEGYFKKQAETKLFRAKREEELAGLLGVRMRLNHGLSRDRSGKALAELVKAGAGRDMLARVVKKAKAERVGTAIADLSVCGAIAPYSHLLGGKLVAMLMASPEVREEYKRRYSGTPSIIASSMAGRQVKRPAELVCISTTSLYGKRPNQYDRIAIPGRLWGKDGEVRYCYLGGTLGKGTYQFSSDSMDAMETMLERLGKRRVNHIFGEGANPRMRAVRDGLDLLRFPSDAFLSHGTPRLIYVMGLVTNLAEYLLGMEKRPKWIVDVPEGKTAEVVTQAIAEYWRERWMMRRVVDEEVMAKVRGETQVYPITHGARVKLPKTLDDQMELWEE